MLRRVRTAYVVLRPGEHDASGFQVLPHRKRAVEGNYQHLLQFLSLSLNITAPVLLLPLRHLVLLGSNNFRLGYYLKQIVVNQYWPYDH